MRSSFIDGTMLEFSAIMLLSKLRSRSGAHRDTTTTLLMVGSGSKTVIFASPKALGQHPCEMQGEHRLKVDPLEGSEPVESSIWTKWVLKPGDAVLLPAMWWHSIESQADTIALSVEVSTSNEGDASFLQNPLKIQCGSRALPSDWKSTATFLRLVARLRAANERAVRPRRSAKASFSVASLSSANAASCVCPLAQPEMRM